MNIRPFEIVLIAIFAISAIVGIIFLRTADVDNEAEVMVYGSRVNVWGTFNAGEMQRIISDITKTDKGFSVVSYRQVDERSFENELLNAMAEGSAPDLILMPHTMLVTFRTKLTAFPEATLPERTFKNTYIDGAEIWRLSDGTYALPLAVDPLVLFWNRDLFASAGIALPPLTWEQLVSEYVPALTKVDARRAVTQSALGAGEFINVNHAKEILSLLLFQAGTNIVEEESGRYTITLNERREGMSPPGESAVGFFTQFADPSSAAYTWNRTIQLDRNAFTAGRLAMYLGMGSEIGAIETENPNMNFDIAPVPQAQGATALRNYGTFYGFVIPKSSKNVTGAYFAAQKLVSPAVAKEITAAFSLTPVVRSLYSGVPDGVYGEVLREAGLITRAWLDPSAPDSRDTMKTMVEGVASGRKEVEEVIGDAAYALETLFR